MEYAAKKQHTSNKNNMIPADIYFLKFNNRNTRKKV